MPFELPSFAHRAALTEWMDEPCSYEDYRACLRDLERVNRTLIAYRPTLAWIDRFLLPGRGPLHIVDVGCGGGDMLRRIEARCRAAGLSARLTGIDLNPYAARAAREFTPPASSIEWITGDAFALSASAPVDLVVSSLFTHHLADEEIVRFLAWMEARSRLGWFINDLRRQSSSYYGFAALATLMRWHRFVRHDGPVSIRRSFSRADWLRYAEAAGLPARELQIEEKLPGRLCVGRVKLQTERRSNPAVNIGADPEGISVTDRRRDA